MGLLSAIGGAIGLVTGGPIGAALGSGIGSLLGGGDIGDALKSGILGFGIGSIPGVQGMAAAGMGAIGAQGAASTLSQMAQNPNFIGKAVQGMTGAAGQAMSGMTGAAPAAAAGAGAVPGAGGLSSLLKFAENPLVLSTALELMDRSNMKDVSAQVQSGERLPDYRGTAVPGGGRYRAAPVTQVPVPGQRYAMGGYVQGPGTGRSDSIPAKIYQNGMPVEEAALSDGEFVMTNQAVRGAGGGDRKAGAARMYQMMRDFERRA